MEQLDCEARFLKEQPGKRLSALEHGSREVRKCFSTGEQIPNQ